MYILHWNGWVIWIDYVGAIHESPLHESPLHESPLHESPLHKSPLHESPLHDRPYMNRPYFAVAVAVAFINLSAHSIKYLMFGASVWPPSC